MLYFTRWKALGIILTALIVCLCAVPNFFPEAQVKTWPAWRSAGSCSASTSRAAPTCCSRSIPAM
ncbi:hypothetical protein ACQ5SK_44675 [Bradyrhizobium japonicum]